MKDQGTDDRFTDVNVGLPAEEDMEIDGLKPGDEGYLEALCKKHEIEYIDETKEAE